MTMSIVSRFDMSSGRAEFYTDQFRTVLETHMVWLKQHTSTINITIDPHIAYKYENDFNGLMNYYSVPRDLQWLNMRVNGMFSPLEFKRDMVTIRLVDQEIVSQLYSRYCTGYKNNWIK